MSLPPKLLLNILGSQKGNVRVICISQYLQSVLVYHYKADKIRLNCTLASPNQLRRLWSNTPGKKKLRGTQPSDPVSQPKETTLKLNPFMGISEQFDRKANISITGDSVPYISDVSFKPVHTSGVNSEIM